MTQSADPNLIRLIYLVSGQVLIARMSVRENGSKIRRVYNPMELMATPGFDPETNRPNGKMEISLIPYGHLAGYQIATVSFMLLSEDHYFCVAAVEDKELEKKFAQSVADSTLTPQ